MAYSIYGKKWTLEGTLENNVLKLELVADDGERESVYAKNLTNVDGCPEWDYAGDGLFWSETRWEDGDKVPTADATKITPDEWARKTAIEAVDALIEQECNIPGSDDYPERNDLIYDVSQWLTEQYRGIFAEAGAEYAANRRLEEEAATAYTAIYLENPNLSASVDEFPIDFEKFLKWWNNGGAAIWIGLRSEIADEMSRRGEKFDENEIIVNPFPILDYHTRVIVLPSGTANEYISRAEKIDGWRCNAGTGYKRTALSVQEVKEPVAPKWMGTISESNRKLLKADD